MMGKVSESSDGEEKIFKMIHTSESNEHLLPEEYVPSEKDVICGWARQNYHHGKSLLNIKKTISNLLCNNNSSRRQPLFFVYRG
jgi:hypothetical protein